MGSIEGVTGAGAYATAWWPRESACHCQDERALPRIPKPPSSPPARSFAMTSKNGSQNESSDSYHPVGFMSKPSPLVRNRRNHEDRVGPDEQRNFINLERPSQTKPLSTQNCTTTSRRLASKRLHKAGVAGAPRSLRKAATMSGRISSNAAMPSIAATTIGWPHSAADAI